MKKKKWYRSVSMKGNLLVLQYSSDNAIGVSILAAQGAGLWLK